MTHRGPKGDFCSSWPVLAEFARNLFSQTLRLLSSQASGRGNLASSCLRRNIGRTLLSPVNSILFVKGCYHRSEQGQDDSV